jgi:hypothetical protein
MTAREAMSRPLKHTSKQLRWIVLGGAATWWTGALQHIKGLLLLPGYVRWTLFLAFIRQIYKC